MKRILTGTLRLAGWLVILAMPVMVGCEDEDSPDTGGVDEWFASHPWVQDPRTTGDSDVRISPSQAQIAFVGQEFVFTASGGETPYYWSMAFNDRGMLKVRPGNSQAVYTVADVAENNVIVYDHNCHAAIARVTPGIPEALKVTATPDTLNANGDKSLLTVSGGIPTYTWTVADVLLGKLDANTGAEVIYTRKLPGDNSVRVEDSEGNFANVVIAQP